MSIDEKKKAKKEIAQLLIEGDFQMASAKMGEKNLTSMDMTEIAGDAVRSLEKDKKFNQAIELCETYNLPVEQKIEIVSAQFRLLTNEKEYEKAHDWGIKYGISQNDLNANAVSAFEDALEAEDVKKALGLMEHYSIKPELVANSARISFNKYYENKVYLNAFYLGNKFEMSPKRTLTA